MLILNRSPTSLRQNQSTALSHPPSTRRLNSSRAIHLPDTYPPPAHHRASASARDLPTPAPAYAPPFASLPVPCQPISNLQQTTVVTNYTIDRNARAIIASAVPIPSPHVIPPPQSEICAIWLPNRTAGGSAFHQTTEYTTTCEIQRIGTWPGGVCDIYRGCFQVGH